MKLLIDADGCPVTEIAVEICRKFHIPCLILCDTAHQIEYQGAQTIISDIGADSVDFSLTAKVCPGDLVITQDYGLAAMCLTRKAHIINQDGWEYTENNIDSLLYIRHISQKNRMAGRRINCIKKRSRKQDESFARSLTKILKQYSTDKNSVAHE